ncbi:putative leucine-rich repeat-containing protein DDB_G0290503 [Chironomus tepperi]|uniref:putative leucine-rich repeat-containing protein DDB_G0290503 n=1 Tax=Chironomus tepperi TaxID=113505 RepID=UPI00391FADB1
MVFPNLIYFDLTDNGIEVIEQGLFDYNPNLEVVGFDEPNIIYIDPNVFDNLNRLSHFWFEKVPCIAQYISNSKEKVQSAIKVVKSKCPNSDFLFLSTQLKSLESMSKTLDSAVFDAKLESFEKSSKNSKFLKFRPLSSKIEILKNEKCSNCKQMKKIESIDTKLNVVTKTVDDGQKKVIEYFEDLKLFQCGLKSPIDDLQNNLQKSQLVTSESISKLGQEITSLSPKVADIQKYQKIALNPFNSGLKSMLNKLEHLKSSQCGLKGPVDDLKGSQNALQITIKDIKSLIDNSQNQLNISQLIMAESLSQLGKEILDIKSSQVASFSELSPKVIDILKSQNQLISLHGPQSTSINNIIAILNEYDKTQKNHEIVLGDLKSLQNDTNSVIKELKLSHDITRTVQDFSLINITSKLDDVNKNIKSGQDDIKLLNSEIVAILSDHTIVHNEAKNSFTKIKTVQNEIKKSLNDLTANINHEMTDKFTSLSDKVESLEPHFMDFEGKIDEKFVRIEDQLSNKFHRMSINFDEKIKGIEMRLMKNLGANLEEKLGKMLDEKLGKMLDEKLENLFVKIQK